MGDNKSILIQMICENIPDAMYILDTKGNTLWYNNAILDVFCCPSRSMYEMIYAQIPKLLSSAQLKRTDNDLLYQKTVTQNVKTSDWCQMIDINGKTRMYYIEQYPIIDADGKVAYVVGRTRSQEQLDAEYGQIQSKWLQYNTRSHNPMKLRTNGGPDASELIYRSPKMERIISQIDNLADTSATVLIQGETGTGKEVLAKYIHKKSNRCKKDMVSINCASIPDSLFESELFGYTKGSFTGAKTDGKPGLVECADKSSLFLDEIDSLPMEQQGKLLRLIETKQIQRIGSTNNIDVDFRLIVATNQNISKLVSERKFRADLFYRINVVTVTIPPLRERREDIRPLADYFLKQYCWKYNLNRSFSESAYKQLEEYSWPGNVRQLKNLIERIVCTSDISVNEINTVNLAAEPEMKIPHGLITDEFSDYINLISAQDYFSLDQYLENCEKKILTLALNSFETAKSAAQYLGIDPSTMSRKMSKYNLTRTRNDTYSCDEEK